MIKKITALNIINCKFCSAVFILFVLTQCASEEPVYRRSPPISKPQSQQQYYQGYPNSQQYSGSQNYNQHYSGAPNSRAYNNPYDFSPVNTKEATDNDQTYVLPTEYFLR